jgi:hypothetical protein
MKHDSDKHFPYKPGAVVRATCTIVEDGKSDGDPKAPFLKDARPDPIYIHAIEGDVGYVAGVDDGTPTMRFLDRGTATVVGSHEVTPAEEEDPAWVAEFLSNHPEKAWGLALDDLYIPET